jgi:hypothetical protein
VVAGGDDDEQHEERIEHSRETRRAPARIAQKTAADDDRVADVHARNRRERVVERADQAAVQIDVRPRDRVGDPEPRESRRGGRIQDESDERERAGEEQRRADQRIRRWATAVEPEQEDGRRGQMKRQVRDAEDTDQSRHEVRVNLHPALEENVHRPLDRRDPMRMADRHATVADHQAPGGFVAGVEREHRQRLRTEGMPHGQPLAGCPCGWTN